MGNQIYDTSFFPYSKQRWLQTCNPNILISEKGFLQANVSFLNFLTPDDIKYFIMRSLHKKYLVDIYAIYETCKASKFIKIPKNGSNNNYAVLAEKIVYRLPDLGSLSYKDGIYILRQVVRGIKILQKQFNNFSIEEEAIGINQQGECKIWINSNYFRNQIQSFIQEDSQSQITNEFLSSDTQNLCCLALGRQFNFKLNSKICSREPHVNKDKIIEKIIMIIESRMLHNLSEEEKQKYANFKITYFYKNILRKNPINKSKSEDNGSSRVVTYRRSMKSSHQLNLFQVPPYYSYTVQGAEAFVDSLCEDCGIEEDYKIKNEYFRKQDELFEKNKKEKLIRVNSTSQILQKIQIQKYQKSVSHIKRDDQSLLNLQKKTSLKREGKVYLEGDCSTLRRDENVQMKPSRVIEKSKFDGIKKMLLDNYVSEQSSRQNSRQKERNKSISKENGNENKRKKVHVKQSVSKIEASIKRRKNLAYIRKSIQQLSNSKKIDERRLLQISKLQEQRSKNERVINRSQRNDKSIRGNKGPQLQLFSSSTKRLLPLKDDFSTKMTAYSQTNLNSPSMSVAAASYSNQYSSIVLHLKKQSLIEFDRSNKYESISRTEKNKSLILRESQITPTFIKQNYIF